MSLGLSLAMTLGNPALSAGGVPAPYPAPEGFHWEYVYEGTDPVYEGSERVVELVSIAA